MVERHSVGLPNGRVIPDWPWIVTPDYVNVVAVAEEGRFIFKTGPRFPERGLVWLE